MTAEMRERDRNTARNIVESLVAGVMLIGLAVASWAGNEARIELTKVVTQQETQARDLQEVKQLVREVRDDTGGKIERIERRVQSIEIDLAKRGAE